MENNKENNKKELNHIMKKFSLKGENEDNLIDRNFNEEKDISNIYKLSDEVKYKIKYADLLKIIKERDKKEKNFENEFYCNILLMPSQIEISDKISTLSLLSYCYQIRENCDNIYLISNKFEKNIDILNNVDQNFFLKVFCRAAYFLHKQQNYFYAYKYIKKCLNLIKNNSSTFSKASKKVIDDYYIEMESDFKKYIKSKEEYFKDINCIPECQKIKKLVDSLISEEYNINKKEEENNNNYIYATNIEWLIKVKFFIEPYLVRTEDKIKIIEKIFDLNDVYNSYFNEKDRKKDTLSKSNCLYPGPINNFPLVSFKDSWKDDINLDENDFIKKNIERNKDYRFVNSSDWNLLKNLFDCTNEIKRKINNLELIEIKFILFDKRIRASKKNINMIKEKYIQINKNSTLKQLRDKILNCANNELKYFNEKIINKNDQDVGFYILNKDKKNILIEISMAFVNQMVIFECPYIEKLEFQDKNTLNDFFSKYNKKEHVLIIEIIEKNNINFLVQLDNNYKCSNCGEVIKNLNKKYNCELCHYSIFCSQRCSLKSEDHKDLHNQLKKIFEPKFILSDFLSSDFISSLPNLTNYGRVGLTNLDNTSHINSVLQCLSNTIDLTKYFLKEYYKKEINTGNYFGSKGELSEEYYKLINKMWMGHKSEYNPKDFILKFCSVNKTFINQEREQDASQFLSFLLDKLHEDLNRITNKKYLELEEKKDMETDKQASDRWWNYFKSRDNSFIVDLFQGQYKTIIKCFGCGKESITYDKYMILGLPIPLKKTQFPMKLFTKNGNYIDLIINIDEKTEIKDIIINSISYIDKKEYIDYIKKENNIKDHLFNYNITEAPINLLYNNIQLIELDKKLKILKIFQPCYENIIKYENKNIKEIPFDKLKYLDFVKNKNHSEFVLLEKDINSNSENYIDIYVYPITEVEDEGIASMMNLKTVTKNKILSYPVIVNIKKDDTLKDLKLLIFKRFQKILYSQSQNQLSSIELFYPHFNKKWDLLKIKNIVCPICKKSYDIRTKCCNLFKSLDKKDLISNLIKKLNKDMPLILLAKSSEYHPNKNIYNGMNLFFEKKNENEKSKSNLTLEDSLDLLNKGEIFDGKNMRYCNKCKENKKAQKKIELYRTPYYLIIQLKRFDQKNKNDTFIEYKEVLDLKNYVVGPDKNKSVYDLYGIVLHQKSINSSNYISYCKNSSVWLDYEDDNIYRIKNPIDKDAYILFYKRRSYE